MSDAGHVTVVGIFVEYKNRLALLLIQHRNITKIRKFGYNLARLLYQVVLDFSMFVQLLMQSCSRSSI